MSESEKACFASHYLLWQECVRLNEKILILEDDIVFNKEFIEHLNEILSLDYEMLRFNYQENKIAYRVDKNVALVLKNNLFFSFSYIINPKGAKKLLENAKIWFAPVDYYLDMYYFHKVYNLMYIKAFRLKQVQIYKQNVL